MLDRVNYIGNPNLGVFMRANDKFALAPDGCSAKFSSILKTALEVEVLKTSISGTSLLGAMVAMNNNGIVLPKNVYKAEVKAFKGLGMNTTVLDDKLTALGNLLLVNDNGGIIGKNFTKKSKKKIEDTLDIEVESSMLANFRTVGAVGVATNKGAVIHPMVTEEDLELVESLLKVYVDVGTINRGVGFVRTGLVANSNGAVMGQQTTGPEIARIEDVFGFLE